MGYDNDFKPWEAALCVALAVMLIWHFIKYLLPMLQKSLYLELDEEKINFWHKHLIVYEQEIEKVTVGFFGNSVILKLKNKRKVRIYLNGIRGNNGDIAKAIFAFSKTKDAEKLSHYVL
jgi:hypothetical protein